ncbi:MAG: iron-containing alcohol dehydrogenase [Rhodospirillales bacterium]|jgi:alcohol dehydrogenase YqhD (iron-dependent ADH family)|nr:iron-containing alcohol dehydrogenase [Rhodospirillales bacterium]
MKPFEWSLPTKMVYGAGEIKRLGEEAKAFGKKAFFVTFEPVEAAAFIRESALASLAEAGVETVIYDKIEPNPSVKTIDEGVRQFKECGADVVVAVGGGSAIDAAKYIASVAESGGSSWDYVVLASHTPREYTGAYPVIAVPTVSAAGSEVNAGGVITNTDLKLKSFSRSPYRIPKVAIIDPELITSLPVSVTGDGGVDIFCHLIEHYLSTPEVSEIADRFTEAMILTLMEYLPRALEDGNDLEARGQVALCSAFGWSGIQALGRLGSIPIHFIEHQLSAHYVLSHGRGMTILLPAYLDYFADALPARWSKLARRCFGVTETDDAVAAKALSGEVVKWLQSMDVHRTLADEGIGDEKFEQMLDDIFEMYGTPENKIPGARPMTRADIKQVFVGSLGA